MARAALVTLGTGSVALSPACTSTTGRLIPAEPDGSAIGEAVDGGMVAVFYGSVSGLGTCESIQDCDVSFVEAPEALCCIQKACVVEATAASVPCLDPDVQMIQASSFDRSCDAGTDCVAIAEGNFCIPGAANCPNAAINKSGMALYQAEVANTNAAFCYAPGTCATQGCVPQCVGGRCEMDTCASSGDAGDAAVEAGDAGDAAIERGDADRAADAGDD